MAAEFRFTHTAQLRLEPGTDARAPGGAVTVALCRHWDHDGACRWPHHNSIDTSSVPARLITRFDASNRDEASVRTRIDAALRASADWTVVRTGPDT